MNRRQAFQLCLPRWRAGLTPLVSLARRASEDRFASLAGASGWCACEDLYKDRAEARSAFVSKCHAFLQQEVCVAIVDPVTERAANLYAELAERIGARPPATAGRSIYAVSFRARSSGRRQQVQAWEHALEVGAPLPTLPLWISESQYVPLELERTYEETCKGLRIP